MTTTKRYRRHVATVAAVAGALVSSAALAGSGDAVPSSRPTSLPPDIWLPDSPTARSDRTLTRPVAGQSAVQVQVALATRNDAILLAQQETGPGAVRTDAPGGTPPKDGAFRLGGFYQGTAAYTYSDPTHWSRGVQRLQLTGEGKLGENVKYKIGGRLDVDPVYEWSNFYLPDVQKDQRVSAIWGENYIDFGAGGWDFRLGAQHIIWGEVVGLFFADVVSARDTRDFLLPSFDIIRIPQWAARAEYFWGDSHVEIAWIPVPTFDRIGKPGADFYPFPLPSPTPEIVASQFSDPTTPSRTLGNSNYGIRANTLVSGWDLAAFYYRSYSAQPTFYRYSGTNPAQPVVFQPQHDRMWQAGSTVSKDFDSFVLRGEVVYTHGRNYESTDPTAPQGVVQRNALDYIASVEFPFEQMDGRVNLQAFQRVYLNGGADTVALDSGDFGLSALISAKVTSEWEPQLLWIQTFGGGGGMIRPRLNWYPMKNSTVSFGVDIFTGPSDGLFGRYDNRDRVYVELLHTF